MELGVLIVLGLAALVVWMAIKIVPQQEAWVIENFGKFNTTHQEGGLVFLIPVMQRVAYKHSLKEQVVDVQAQTAITRDNVSLRIDGILYVKVINAVDASYGVSDPYFAVAQLAQTTMRAEIGKLTLDKTFEEREMLNTNIVDAINDAAGKWGVQCMRYEIKDINPPTSVLQAMELQMTAERNKRADVLESEGKRDAQINVAEAQKREVVLESEAAQTDQINRAKGQAEAIVLNSEAAKTDQINRAMGEAEAIKLVAEATAEGIQKVAAEVTKTGGSDAVNLRVAEQYVNAFAGIAKTSNTVLLPANLNEPGSMVAQAMTIFENIKKDKKAS